jgi:Fe-S-cluster-containing dehydrogenase component
VIRVNEKKCNGCLWCLGACPFGAISLDPEKKTVAVCDYCDGDPECVKYCPFDGALTYGPIDEIAHAKRKDVFKRIIEETAGKKA